MVKEEERMEQRELFDQPFIFVRMADID